MASAVEKAQVSSVSRNSQSGVETAPEGSLTRLQVIASQLREYEESLRQKRILREANQSPERPGEPDLRKLDSSVKHNSALIKKFRQISEDTKQSILHDIRLTNQGKYVSEAVSAFSESSIKPKDISAALQIISLLHQRYAEFGPALATTLTQNLLLATQEGPSKSDDDRPSLPKLRTWLRLLAGMISLSIGGELKPFYRILKNLSDADYSLEKDRAQTYLSVLSSFAKAGHEDFLGLPPPVPDLPQPQTDEADAEEQEFREVLQKQIASLQAAEGKSFMSKSMQDLVLKTLTSAFEKACQAVEREHTALLELEDQNLRILNHRGDLPEDYSAKYESQRKGFDNLHKSAAALAESLGLKLPVLESGVTRLKGSEPAIGVLGRKENILGPFDDEETHAFYASLPDLRALVPSVLLDKNQESEDSGAGIASLPANELPQSDSQMPKEVQTLPPEADGFLEKDSVVGPEEAPKQDATAGHDARGETEEAVEQIRNCTNRQSADDAALAFCYLNSKGARRRLVKMLLTDQRIAVQQIPFFARIVALLAPVFSDISAVCLAGLEAEFYKLLATKDTSPRMYDARLRNSRFLSELTKFKICPYGTFFIMLKSLLDDFQGHNIDTAANLVEGAGRYLILLPETTQRMGNMLEVMMKLKSSRNVDPRQGLAVDSAFLVCKPPEHSLAKRSKQKPQRQYMRYLVHDLLSEDELKQVVKTLRRYSWKEDEDYFARCMLSGVKGRFSRIPLLASLAASLSKYHPTIAVTLADELLEEVHEALRNPDTGTYQRRVGHMKLLGEMYNYRLLDSQTVFDTLYLLLSFGHQSPEDSAKLDPPANYFRIRLVCVLLSTCGQYFSKGSSGARLDRFLTYFQRYLLYKPPLPLDVEFDVQDLLEHLRPKLARFETFEEACQAVEDLEAAEAAQSFGDQSDQSDSEDDAKSESAEGRRGQTAELEQGVSDDAHQTSTDDYEDDDNDDVKLLQPVHATKQEVDEEFERELEALTVRGASNTLREETSVQQVGDADDSAASTQTVAFKVMLRKGVHSRTRAIQVPATLSLAVTSKEGYAQDAAERAEMKRLVLEAGTRDDDTNDPPIKQKTMTGPEGKLLRPGGREVITSVRERSASDGSLSRGRFQSRGRGRRHATAGFSLPPVEEGPAD